MTRYVDDHQCIEHSVRVVRQYIYRWILHRYFTKIYAVEESFNENNIRLLTDDFPT